MLFLWVWRVFQRADVFEKHILHFSEPWRCMPSTLSKIPLKALVEQKQTKSSKNLPCGWFPLVFGCFCSTRAFRGPLERVLGNHMHRHSSEKCKMCFSNTSARWKTLQTHKNNILEPLRIWWSRSLYRVKNVPLDMSHTVLVREILTKSPQNPIQKPDFLKISWKPGHIFDSAERTAPPNP